MPTGGALDADVGGTIHRLEAQLDTSLGRSIDLHRAGGNEEAVLAETAVAVGAAKASSSLREDWEAQLQRREQAAGSGSSAPAEPKGWGRGKRTS